MRTGLGLRITGFAARVLLALVGVCLLVCGVTIVVGREVRKHAPEIIFVIVTDISLESPNGRLALVDVERGIIDSIPHPDDLPLGDLRWIPNETRLAVATIGGTIYLLRSDNSEWDELATGVACYMCAPTWSPDGTWVAFYSGGLYTMRADGSEQHLLVTQMTTSVDWSPDGHQLVFSTFADKNIYRINFDGTDMRPLVVDPSYDGTADWSPDGSTIIYVSNRAGSWDLYSIDPDGDNQRRLTSLLGTEDYAAWSPDGTWIASVDSAAPGIYIMRADGSGLRRVTATENIVVGSHISPIWRP